ncbi:sensor domain-containing protein [Streptomyces sp. C11-1]|uniref:Sensor domain-containing protein n=1 Tax=Streptomyces durocortorensis TaxID=2811104 RepID=A0ABY9VWC5_9ACTN|nr:sensor domain-containing protein [Streptomyces durocortorensis]WNF28018.1 sensor domain-containing protein [Streptomyces durocortorensis]
MTTTETSERGPGQLRLGESPLRLLRSSEPWAATAYLAGYLLIGPVMFAFCLAVLVVSFTLNITMLGLPLLIGAAALVRGCARIERARTRMFSGPVRAEYRTIAPAGVLAGVKARWSDPTTLRDCAYLIALFVPLLLLDAVALLIWLTTIALVLVPAWYWAVPDGGALGLLSVDDLPTAFAAAAVALALTSLSVYAVVGAARLHSTVAHKVLGPRSDPLSEAKRLLAEPGPLAGPTVPESSAGPSSPSRGMTP